MNEEIVKDETIQSLLNTIKFYSNRDDVIAKRMIEMARRLLKLYLIEKKKNKS